MAESPEAFGPVDVVVAGFPCQPVSTAGRRLGEADERWIWPDVVRVIRLCHPRWVLLENVPGLLIRGMGTVLKDLAESGYDAEWDCVPASAIGAAQERDRVWIVAYPQELEEGGLSIREATAITRLGIGGEDVADANREQSQPFESGIRPDTGASRQDVADAPSGRCPADDNEQGVAKQVASGSSGDVAHTDQQRPVSPKAKIFAGRSSTQLCGWWSTEPDVGRVAHGVPSRVDRLRALGNAVVPEVVRQLGFLILAADKTKEE